MSETATNEVSDLRRILVADDEKDILWGIKVMLSPYFRVDVATSGVEVMRMWDSVPYYALILDATFDQGVSGLEIASAIRAEDKEIRIIVFSAKNYSDTFRQSVVNLGAQFIAKPLALAEVLEKLG